MLQITNYQKKISSSSKSLFFFCLFQKEFDHKRMCFKILEHVLKSFYFLK